MMLNILIVLYKKTFDDAETLININDICKSGILANSRLIIWDNSPQKIDERSFDEMKKYISEVIFFHSPENCPLSKIYNSVAETLIKQNDYLILLDHDTKVTLAYFNEIIGLINNNEAPKLLLPQIFVQANIESPAFQYILFSKRWKDLSPGLHAAKNVTAINSGMVISGSIFSNGFRYDERLKFYGTDSFFMFYYSQNYPQFYLLRSVLIHNLNLLSNPSLTEKVKVFKEIKRANKIIYDSNNFYKFLSWINNIIIAFKYSVRYKSVIFFFR